MMRCPRSFYLCCPGGAVQYHALREKYKRTLGSSWTWRRLSDGTKVIYEVSEPDMLYHHLTGKPYHAKERPQNHQR